MLLKYFTFLSSSKLLFWYRRNKNNGFCLYIFQSIDGSVLRTGLGHTHRSNDIQDNMTIVSAFFDIGSFKKGKSGVIHRPKLYHEWSKPFGFITNPVVIFTDSKPFAIMMEKLRSSNGLKNKTKIILVNRTSIWAFQLMTPLTRLFEQKWYPKFYPNTVSPAYSCVQHAKFAVVATAVRKNYFRTLFYAWLDIGYFRQITKQDTFFKINVKLNKIVTDFSLLIN